MLTYRTGAAGAPSAARFMMEHLLQQTLPPEMAAMAEYYEQGVTPPTPADAAASRYSHFAAEDKLPAEDALDALIQAEVARLAESALSPGGRPLGNDELMLRTLAAFAAAGLIERDTALASLRRLSPDGTDWRLEFAMREAGSGRDYSSATATPRRDMNPALALTLGIDPHRGLKPREVACLLNGQRADGGVIEGQTKLAPSLPLAQIFGLDPRRRPTREQLERVLAGQKASGEPLTAKEAERAMRRFLNAFGVKDKLPTAEAREYILASRTADGRELSDRQYQVALEASKARIGYIDLTFSAPKSLSIAWAFAPTKAERAILHRAHRDAIDSVMLAVETEIGRASKGDAAKHGYEPGAIGWVSFDHYAARPTVEIVVQDAQGHPATELHTLTRTDGRVPGDMQVHTHVAVFNAVQTASGRLGSLDLAQLEGRIHEWGALYQAYLASNLRMYGARVELDRRTEMARLPAVPDHVVAQFSKRTLNGTDAARAYASSQGLDWDSLTPERKIGLLKSGVQSPREAKTDDVSDLAAWQKTAASLKYEHRSVLRPKEATPVPSRELRLETAFHTALPILGRQFERRAVIDGADARIAAAKGLIAAGIESPEDVSAITRAFRERGIQRRGEDTALIWGTVKNKQGRDRMAITTTLDLREEKILIWTVKAGSQDKSSALSPSRVNAAVAAFPGINFKDAHGKAQRAIIDQLGMGGRIALAIGVAGSGKSTLLKPLVKAWQDDGRTVYGIALAWRQSDDLADAGIAARNTRAVASFLRVVQLDRLHLDHKSVVVIDEIGLLGTRQLNEILAVQKQTGFQLVMIGDPKQMQSVEAGPVIALLRRALGEDCVPELASSVRQNDAEERKIALMFRNGQTEEAVRRKEANGTLWIVPGGYREAIAQISELWQQRREANADCPGFTISVSAPSNAEAHDISVAIRERRRNLAEVGSDKIKVRRDGWRGSAVL